FILAAVEDKARILALAKFQQRAVDRDARAFVATHGVHRDAYCVGHFRRNSAPRAQIAVKITIQPPRASLTGQSCSPPGLSALSLENGDSSAPSESFTPRSSIVSPSARG